MWDSARGYRLDVVRLLFGPINSVFDSRHGILFLAIVIGPIHPHVGEGSSCRMPLRVLQMYPQFRCTALSQNAAEIRGHISIDLYVRELFPLRDGIDD